MSEKLVFLATSTEPVLHSLMEEILKDAGIPFEVREGGSVSVVLGAASPLGYSQVLVPQDRLEEAKEALCGNGIVCDVSERMIRRTIEEVVRPLLGIDPGGRDFERLSYLVDINNKETVRALFEATLKEPDGRVLLNDFFFQLALAGSPALKTLARVLSADMTPEFGGRLRREFDLSGNEVRQRLLDVLPELPSTPWRLDFLVEGLRSDDLEIRTAASEALFAVKHGIDYGYDPDDPPEEREAAIKRLL